MTDHIMRTPSETQELGRFLAQQYGSEPLLILLEGDLGAGKTTFAQGFLKELLGSQISIQSPTFSYMNHYHGALPIYHFDLYRLEDEIELYNLGLAEFLMNESALRLIEWPNHFPLLYEKAHLIVRLERSIDGVKAKISNVNEHIA